MARGLKSIGLSILVLLPTIPTRGDEAGGFLDALRARENSVVTFEIKLRRAFLPLGLKDYATFKKTLDQATQMAEVTDEAAGRWADELVRTWSKDATWFAEHICQRDGCYKQVRQGRSLDIEVYDGCLHYDYSQINEQLDIHSSIPNIAHVGLGDVGLKCASIGNRTEPPSWRWDSAIDRYVLTRRTDTSQVSEYQYNRDLALCHAQHQYADGISLEDIFFWHRTVGRYPVPRVRVALSRNARRNTCSVRIYVIEEVNVNPPVADTDLRLGELPDSTLVIDYRFGSRLALQWRWGERDETAGDSASIMAGRCRPDDFAAFLHRTGAQRKAYALRDSRLGRPAPPLHIAHWLSEPLAIDNWPPARFTVINFCSRSCGYCVAEIPETRELARWLAREGASFFSIHSAGEQESTTTGFLNTHQIDYPVALDGVGDQAASWGSATFAEYGISGIPAYVTIGLDGRVLSYDRMPRKEKLQGLMEAGSEPVEARAISTPRAMAMPKIWRAHDLEPGTLVETRFFVFRPDTPTLILQRPEDLPDGMTLDWAPHNMDGQTVYEVRVTAQPPAWGQTQAGQIVLLTRHNAIEEQIVIPYTLRSKGLIDCASGALWFGCVDSGNVVSLPLPFRIPSDRKIGIRMLDVPKGLDLTKFDGSSRETAPWVSFSSAVPGLHHGRLEVLVSDNQGNRQPVSLGYSAFVRPALSNHP